MDVRCARCKTDYELDEVQVPSAGITVRCTECSHLFRVKRRGAAEGGASVEAAPVASPGSDSAQVTPRRWFLRRADGSVAEFPELGVLQRWMVERQVTPTDELSLTGERWRKLAEIPELVAVFDSLPPELSPPQERLPAAASEPPESPAAARGSGVSIAVSAPAPEPAERADAPDSSKPPPLRPGKPSGAPPAYRPNAQVVYSAARKEGTGDDLVAAGLRRPSRARFWALAVVALGVGAGVAFVRWGGGEGPSPQSANSAIPPTEVAATEVAATEVAVTPKPLDEATSPTDGSVAVVGAQATPAGARAGAPEETADPVTPSPEAAEPGVPTEPPAPARDFDAWLKEGNRLRGRGRYEGALEAYRQAMALSPRRAEPWAGRGLVLLDQGSLNAAVDAFQEALERNPRYAVAVMGVAETYRALGHTEQALRYYQEYLEQFPGGPEAEVARRNIERLKE